MKLHELQQEFAAAIVANRPEAVAESICGNSISQAERLSVYHHNVIGNLVDVLAETFRATQTLVGEEFFRGMARQFVPSRLPAIANLNGYSADFPGFIASYAPACELPYLAEVAHFEALWNEAYLAADDAALTSQDMTALLPEDYPSLNIRLRASARLMAAAYPVDAVWRWCKEGGEAQVPDMNAGGCFLLILRPELDVEVLRLSRPEYRMLQALFVGSTLETAADQVLWEDAAFDFSAFLSRHFAARTFQSLIQS